MKTTIPMVARVKISTKRAFEDAAVKSGLTVPAILNLLGGFIEEEYIQFENGELVVEVDNTPSEYEDLHLNRLVQAMRDREYDDDEIRAQVSDFIGAIRSRDWGC